MMRYIAVLVAFAIVSCRQGDTGNASQEGGLNILFVISDDQSFPHASAYGTSWVSTPSFDRVAERGVLFTHAFVAAPQCSPSRAAILTGRNIWQLEEAGTHSSYFPRKFPVFTALLAEQGYAVGYTGKAWGPGNWKDAGWPQNPVGKEYNSARFETVPTAGINRIDYATNFEIFLDERKSKDQPFFFWLGTHEPHRDFEYGSGRRLLGKDNPGLPGFLPQHDSISNDLLDYAYEISWFDQQLGKALEILEKRGLLDNTIVVVTADNGMAFPHAKANMHEYGIHVPLAISGPSIPQRRTIEDFVTLIDLAPTFLEFAGVPPMDGIAGRSLVDVLTSGESGIVDPTRKYIVSGRERHTHARPDNLGYPARAIRTRDFLYIRNLEPSRWPVGDPPTQNTPLTPNDDPETRPVVQGYEDIDDSPSKRLMIANRNQWKELFELSFGLRPEEQLYDLRKDPECTNDVATDPAYATVRVELWTTLKEELTKENDPRITGNGSIFDSYPRFGRMRAFPGFRERGSYNRSLQ